MIRLPEAARRAHLRSFWLSVTALFGLTGAVVGLTLELPRGVVVPGVTAIGLAVVGMFVPEWIEPCYRVWNGAARRVGRAARLVVTSICYFVVVAIVAKADAPFERRRPAAGTSQWIPRHRSPRIPDDADGPWMSVYIAWAWRTGNGWALVLMPFLMVLAAVAEEDEQALPAHLYTLF